MTRLSLTVACGDYDRTRAIKDGRVTVEGCDVTYLPMEPEEAFHRAFKHQEFDVCELSFSSYLRTVDADTSPYVGVPAFVSRLFRHSAVYIRTDRGIRHPSDLKGKLIGLPEYQITAVVWLRGIMQDEYGVKPTDIRWRQGGIEEPGRTERTPLKPIPGLDLKSVPDKALSQMLEAGELDAILDEGIPTSWFAEALGHGMEPITLDEHAFRHLEAIGWRRVTIPAGRYPGLKADYTCIDYSGWPIYTRASLPDNDAYKICDAIVARKDQIYWEDSYTGVGQLGENTDATPRDVPLHPGAEKWYREHGFNV